MLINSNGLSKKLSMCIVDYCYENVEWQYFEVFYNPKVKEESTKSLIKYTDRIMIDIIKDSSCL